MGLSSRRRFLKAVPAAGAAYGIGEDGIYSPEFQRRTAWILLALAVLEALTGFGPGPSTFNLYTPHRAAF